MEAEMLRGVLGMTNRHDTPIGQYRDVESLSYYGILLEHAPGELPTLRQ